MKPDTEKRLKAIENTTPTLKPLDHGFFEITLVEGNILEGRIVKNAEGQRCGSVEYLEVFGDLQGHGIGTRLLRSAFRHCIELGVEYVDSGVINATVLRIYGKILGEATLHALHFMQPTVADESELPLSLEQAIASSERADEVRKAADEDEQERMDIGIKVRVHLADLAGVDTSSWERPVPLQ